MNLTSDFHLFGEFFASSSLLLITTIFVIFTLHKYRAVTFGLGAKLLIHLCVVWICPNLTYYSLLVLLQPSTVVFVLCEYERRYSDAKNNTSSHVGWTSA